MRRGGRGGPVVLLLHGLGATADVWDGLAALLPGEWVAPDLPGHGGSARLPVYTFAAVAEAVGDLVDPAGTVILGHSFGGVVGLHLAARPGVRAVIGLGIKVAWTDEELARAAVLSAREPARFDSRAEAVDRHLRLSGLTGLAEPDSAAGVVQEDGRWRGWWSATGRGQQSSSSFAAAKSILVADVIVSPGETFWLHTFQFRSDTCIRPAPVASCDVVIAIP